MDESEGGNKDEVGEVDPTFFVIRDGESAADYSDRVFERVFNTDVKNVRKITVRFASFPIGDTSVADPNKNSMEIFWRVLLHIPLWIRHA